MSFAIALCLLVTSPPSPDARLTVRQTGNVAALLKEISAQANVELTAGKREGSEILIVSLANVPLSEAMERIAWATYGQWEKTEGGYRLVHNIVDERRTERAYIEAAAKVAADSIAEYRSKVLQPGLSDDAAGRAALPRERNPYTQQVLGPDARLMAKLLAFVSPKDLVNPQSDDDPVVYSTHPTPAQRPFGPGAEAILRQYATENANALELLPARAYPLRALLTGSATPTGGAASLTVYSAQGESLLGLIRRNVVMFEKILTPTVRVPKAFQEAIPADMPVPLSAASRVFATPPRVGEDTFPTRQALRQMPEFMTRLKNPEKFEPMGTFVTDAWTAAAAKVGRNLVANLDDHLFVPSWRGAPPKMRDVLFQFSQADMKLEPGWLVARPVLANPPWGHRVDRAALGRYVRAAGGWREPAEFEAAATFITTCGTPKLPRGIADYLYWAKELEVPTRMNAEWSLERFYGSLPEGVRRAWLQGGPVDVSRLSLESRRALQKWVFMPNWEILQPRQPMDSYSQEPTVRFPLGAPTVGVLRAETKEEAGFATRFPFDGGLGERWDSLNSLAWLLNALVDGGKDVEIQPSMQRSLRLIASLPGGEETYRTLKWYDRAPGKYVPWQKAPAETVKQIEAERAKQRAGKSNG